MPRREFPPRSGSPWRWRDQKREESKGLQCCIARGVGAVEDAKERDHFRRVLKCCPKAQCPAWSEAALKDFNLDRAEWDFDEQPGVKVKQRTKKPRESLEDYSESMLVPHRCNTGGSHAPSLPQTRATSTTHCTAVNDIMPILRSHPSLFVSASAYMLFKVLGKCPPQFVPLEAGRTSCIR